MNTPLKRTMLVAALLVLSFSIVPTAHAARKLSVSPGTFQLSAPAGAEIENEFLVINEGTEAIPHVFVYATNVRVGKNGKETYVLPKPEEPLLSSPASWIYIKVPDPTKIIGNFPFIDLGLNDTKSVSFSVKIPEEAPPGDYTIIVFFEAREPGSEGRFSAAVSARIGCRIKIRVQGDIVEKEEITNLQIGRFVVGDVVPYSFALVNSGNIDAPGRLEARVETPSGVTIASKVLQRRVYLYAKSRLDFAGALKSKGLGFGMRTFRTTFTYRDDEGNERALEKKASFFAIPVSVFYLLLIVLAAIVLAISFWLDARLKKRGKAFQT